MDRKDIFMSGFKSKIGYSFTYKDLNEFEAIIDFYEQQCEKQKEVIDKAIEYIQNHQLVFKYATLEEIEVWFNQFYINVLDILNEVSK